MQLDPVCSKDRPVALGVTVVRTVLGARGYGDLRRRRRTNKLVGENKARCEERAGGDADPQQRMTASPHPWFLVHGHPYVLEKETVDSRIAECVE